MDLIVNTPHPPLPDTYSKDLAGLYDEMMKKNPFERKRINDILKIPFVREKAKSLLDAKYYSAEFAHTHIHGYDLVKEYKLKKAEDKKKAEEMKVSEEEQKEFDLEIEK